MTERNDRLNDPDADTDDGTHVIGHEDGRTPFQSFAVWVNNPVSAYSKHHVPDDLREAIEHVDDHRERERLRAVVDTFEDGTLSPRDFVRLIVESDAVDYFDPLSVPEGWDSTVDDTVPEAESGDHDVGDPCPACGDGELIKGVDGDPLEPADPWCETCGWVVGDGYDERPFEDADAEVTDKGRAPPTDRPEYAIVWPVLIGLLIVALIAVVVFVI